MDVFFLVVFWTLAYSCAPGDGYSLGARGVDWQERARDALRQTLNVKQNNNVAKNIIFFVADGLSQSTITTARIYRGQKQGREGELEQFTFEEFPNVGLHKTFTDSKQVTESGAAATAMLSGTKVTSDTIGLGPRAAWKNCNSEAGNEIQNIFDWSNAAGKWTGVVTTTRVTHATPGSTYAHSANRQWENDASQPEDIRNKCRDIAYQMINNENAKSINVIMGGGRQNFLPNTTADPEYPTTNGKRQDGRDLIQAWKDDKVQRGVSHAYVWDKAGFDDITEDYTDYILGLFEPGHMKYELERDSDTAGEPSLADMVEKAILLLKRRQNSGYFLLVEGGRIDHAHHYNLPKLALEDTIAFDKAVQKATIMTDERDTLIVVTTDHSHPFTMGGYPAINNPILGILDQEGQDYEPALDGMPYLSLGYGNGPAAPYNRVNLTGIQTDGKDYTFPTLLATKYDTHGGEEVPMFARGPMSHLFTGVQENQYLAHAMAYASCVGEYKDNCARNTEKPTPQPCVSGAEYISFSFPILWLCICHLVFY